MRRTLLGMDPSEVEPDTWIGILAAAGLEDELRGMAHPLRWVERVVNARWRYTYWGELSRVVRGLDLRGDELHLDEPATPELCDAVLEAGASVPERLLPDWFHGWATHEAAPELASLAAHPAAIRCAEGINELIRKQADAVLGHAGTRRIMGLWIAEQLGTGATPLTVLAALRTIRGTAWVVRGRPQSWPGRTALRRWRRWPLVSSPATGS